MTERPTPNYSDAERELQRVEEKAVNDRTKAIVEAAERLAQHAQELEVIDILGRVVDRTWTLRDVSQIGSHLVELARALALPAEPAPAPSAIRSTVERLETLRQLVDLTHQNAVLSLQETSRCVQESLAEIRAELGTPGTGAEPAPAWTSTPPSEPGRFWIRYVGKFSDVHQHLAGVKLVYVAMREPRALASGRTVASVAMVYPLEGPGSESCGWVLADSERHGVEWWPVPIEEPPA